jgi:NAD+ dependent glucose-6-phosphate dehydrogenase
MTRLRVLVTGAAGNLGSRIVASMRDRHDVTTLDIAPGGSHNHADLRTVGPWTDLFASQNVVVHLAADRRPEATWPEVLSSNVAATLNIYQAAADHGVRRIVLASSIWVARGAWTGGALPNEVVNPGDNAYGASKAFCEQLAHWYWHTRSISTIALRLGARPPGDARPMRQNPWSDSYWLSPADAIQAMSLAVESNVVGCHVVTVTSHNPAQIWDLTAAARTIGYHPVDTWTPAPRPWRQRLRQRLRRARPW